MQVSLIGKEKIYRINLPKKPIGSYWLSDKTSKEERKIINIEGNGENWQIATNNYAKMINPKSLIITREGCTVKQDIGNTLNKVTLKENSMYAVKIGNSNEVYILYCAEVYEKDFIHLDIKNTQGFTIGSGKNNHIIYNNALLLDVHTVIKKNNEKWIIENYDNRYAVFVNNEPVLNHPKELVNGDVIFIMGLKIIIMKDSIYINQTQENVTYNRNYFEISRIQNNTPQINTIEIDEDGEVELYKDEDYYSRAPRITNLIETKKVKIDAPPHIQEKQETPLLLVLGSSLSMGVMMIISIITAIQGKANGTASTQETVIALITAGVMLIAMLVIPFVNVKYDKKQKIKYEEKRQKRYKHYLNSKIMTINNIMDKQKEILFENYPSGEQCANIILNKNSRLWERKIEDHDFLSLRIGIGNVPLKIDVNYPEEQFQMEDDNLREIVSNIAKESKFIEDTPIVTSLVEKNISAIILKDKELKERYIQNIILQLITFQSYEDLKLVFFLKKDKLKIWEYVKMLPHVWDDTKQIRFFAEDYEDMKEISRYLEEVLKSRTEYQDANYKSFSPYYLIITDNYKQIENLRFITEMLKIKTNIGFSLLCITQDLVQLPNECKTFISIEKGEGILFDNEISSTTQRKVKLEQINDIPFEKISQILSNIPIRFKAVGSSSLPKSYTFLEMFNVGRIEQLNILDRWKRNDSTLSLKTPIGIDSTGNSIVLDVHEKFHGPHGLIAGSTGSGKSEFIITFILSLAINYHPKDVSFLLIDYKGGGLAGAFQKNHIKLPHLVGTITNIDTNGLQRSLTSIQSELRRRQVIFNEARNMTDEGTIDIYKYQKLYHEGVVKEAIPHLLIICDEFAELKQQQEDFMDELMSVSRIGRSLGVHLILATQKPAGIVNDQIKSNSRFAVCLKVQDAQDSMDVIKKPDASNLKNAGQFYLQVGNDEYFTLGQSGWAGAPYFPSEVIKKKVDNSIEFISDIGLPIKKVDNTVQQMMNNAGEQLTNIVKYMCNLAEEEQIRTTNLWLENIPDTIYVKELRKKYNVKVDNDKIEVAFGEYDDPSNQKQGIVKSNLLNKENIIIYGNAESGKETLLSTMIYDLMTTYTTSQVQFYILDFGSEALKIYANAPHVGDVVFNGDDEKLDRFFEMIQKEIKSRKTILSDYNGDFNIYLKTSKEKMPIIVVIINNYEAFSESYEDKFDEILLTITREGLKCGVMFVTTVSTFNDMRYRLSQNFGRKVALQLNSEDEYCNIFDNVGKKKPAHIFGRGLINIEGNEVFEFQTAKICEHVNYNMLIEEKIKELNKTNKLKATPIPTIPDRIYINDVSEYLIDLKQIPVGMTRKDLKIYTYDFTKNFMNIITSKNMDNAIEFSTYVLEQVNKLENINVSILDAEKAMQNKRSGIKGAYNNLIKEIDKKVEEPDDKNSLCVIIGIDKILANAEIDEFEFCEVLKKAEESAEYNFIIIENPNKLKNHEYDEWYKNFVNKESGIWVGDGIEDQFLINVTSDRADLVNYCGCSYGYVIEDGYAKMIKLVGMKENGDENE